MASARTTLGRAVAAPRRVILKVVNTPVVRRIEGWVRPEPAALLKYDVDGERLVLSGRYTLRNRSVHSSSGPGMPARGSRCRTAAQAWSSRSG
jgi:hypothetical protein